MTIQGYRVPKHRIRKDGGYDLRFKEGRRLARSQTLTETSKPAKKRHRRKNTPKKQVRADGGCFLLIAVLLLSIYGASTGQAEASQTIVKPLAEEQQVIEEVVFEEIIEPKLRTIEDMICSYDWTYNGYTYDCETIIAVAKYENGYNENLRLHGNGWKADRQFLEADGTVSTGIMMVNSVHRFPLSELVEFETNIARGYQVFSQQGLTAFGAFTSGGYKEYLK